MNYFINLFQSIKAFSKGLLVTVSWIYKPAITVQYPYEKLTLSDRFRGMLTFSKETCTSCGLCAKACPSECISMEPMFDPATQKRMAKVAWYAIDFGKCNFCHLCEEACPTRPLKSVRHSAQFEVAVSNRKELITVWENVPGSKAAKGTK